MKSRSMGTSIALIIVFGIAGLTQFTENVRTVQVLGLFASGAVIGASLATMIAAVRAKRKAP